MPIIDINSVTKEYRLGQMTNLKESALNFFNRLRGKAFSNVQKFKAIDDITFKVESGEVVGIIGTNGAGKSTLLKLLARVSVPTKGEINVRGSVAPLIEVGAGLHPELTGRENIYLNGSIMGLPRAVIKEKFDEIVEFAELEEFIDTPVKRYSSGMMIRLGFAIATSVDTDILIIDEVLAVGDLAFQRKCFDRMEDMIKRQGKTVLLVSHNIRQVERICSRVILMDYGRAISDGNPTDVCNLFFDRSNEKIKSYSAKIVKKGVQQTEDMNLMGVEILNEKGKATDCIQCLRPMCVRLHFDVCIPLKRIGFLVGFHTTDFVYLTSSNTLGLERDYDVGSYFVDLLIKSITLLPGVYCVRIWIGTSEGRTSYCGENLKTFQVFSDDFFLSRQQDMGLVHIDATWDFDAGDTASTTKRIQAPAATGLRG